MKGMIKMNMRIVDEMRELSQSKMDIVHIGLPFIAIIFLILGLILAIIALEEGQTITHKIITKFIITAITPAIIMSFAFYGFIRVNSYYTIAKVGGDAVLEKYESGGNNEVVAHLKGKDKQTIKLHFDNGDILNQKDKINRGEKVRIQSDKSYALMRMKKGLFQAEEYELRKGSKLIKAE